MTKVVLISDTHNQLDKMTIPEGDILIHAGDFTNQGTIAEISKFNSHLGKLSHRHKVLIAGNHDRLFETQPSLARSLITNATYLEDSWTVVEGLVIFGSPWQPEFNNWAFNLPRGEKLAEKWANIPENADIVITHGPPSRFGDTCPDGFKAGCVDLLTRLLEVRPKLHVSGHIHGGYGIRQWDGMTFVNASSCDEKYRPINEPIVIEL